MTYWTSIWRWTRYQQTVASHKCLPEKSCLDCLRILIMSWLFKDPVVIMKEIMSWLFQDPVVIMKEIMSWLFKDPIVIMKEIMSWLFKDPVVIMKEIMSWLFKVSIVTVAWLSFNHAQSNSKNVLKRSNFTRWNFFSKNNYLNFNVPITCPFHASFILQNSKKILAADPELWGCAIFGPKMAHLSWKKNFWYKLLLLLSSTY